MRAVRWGRVVIGLMTGAVLASPALATSDVRLAIAPFELSPELRDRGVNASIATRLASKMSERSLDRFIAPREFRNYGAKALADPHSRDIRAWSERAEVDAVVVGRVVEENEAGTEIAVEVRSGSSGGALSAYRSTVLRGSMGDGALNELADSILAGLGHPGDIAEKEVATRIAVADVSVPGSVASKAPDSADGTPAPGLRVAGLRGDRPIAINAQELEVISRDDGRTVVFSQDVKVVEGDITLFADYLEAEYPKGKSKPRRLVAKGSVRVQQGDKTAFCDYAEYQRDRQIVTCEGNARLTEECDVVRGEEIRFDLKRDGVRVVGAASVEMRPSCEEPAQ